MFVSLSPGHSLPRHRFSRILILSTIAALFLTAIPAGRVALVNDDPPDYYVTAASAQSQTTQVGDTFAESPAVRVCAYGSNPCQPVGGVNVTFAAPVSGASGTFADTSSHTTTVVSVGSGTFTGMATAPAFTANDIPGSYVVTASAEETFPERALPNFFFFANSELPATNAAMISTGDGSNQATQIGTQFSTQLSVAVFDGSNQLLSGIEVTFTAPSEGASGTFSGTGTPTATATTGGTGIATAPAFTANNELGQYHVTASISGDQTVTGEPLTTSFALRNTSHNPAGVPELISVSAGGAQNVPVLSAYPTNLQVAIFDGNLNHVEGATVVFTLPGEGPSGTFADGSTTFEGTTGSNGLVTASTLTSNTIIGQFSVAVSATKNDITANALIALSIGRVETTTTLSKDPSGDSVFGQPIEVTATVEAVTGGYVPAGPVTFYSSDNAIAHCTETSPTAGDATCLLEFLPVGNYTFTAEYLGDASSQPSSASALTHTVNKADTTVTLESSEPDFVLEGESVTFIASVSVDPPGAGDPSGTVTFTSSDGTVLNGGDPVDLVDGEAVVSTDALQAGTPQITAAYSGDESFNGYTENLTQNVYTIPEVTQDPSDQLVLVGELASFSAAASGTPNPEVQWQVSVDGGETFEDIPGAGETTFSFTVAVEDDQKQFQAVFSNPAGSDTSTSATLTVRQPPSITSDASTTFTVGEAGSFTVSATGVLEPELTSTGDLPDGVSFDAASGILSGTPLPGTGGVYSLTINASNNVEPDAVQNFTLTVIEAPEITSSESTTFIINQSGAFTVTATGYPNPVFSVDGTLPSALDFDDGVLSGIPGETGVFELTITADNGVLPNATQQFVLTVDKAEQETLIVTIDPSSGVTGDRLALGSNGGSGTGEVSFDAGTSSACEIGSGDDAGMLVVIDGTGTCEVTATKAADNFFHSATSEPASVEVSRAETNLSVEPANGTFGGVVTLSATLTGNGELLAGKVVTFSILGSTVGSATTDVDGVATLTDVDLGNVDAGDYPGGIGAGFAGDSGYLPTDATADLVVEKADRSVAIGNIPPNARVGSSFTPSYDYPGDGEPSVESLSINICSIAAGVVYFHAEGLCELRASITEGTNYLAATGPVQSFVVGSAASIKTTTTLVSSANPSSEGELVIFTAYVRVTTSAGGTSAFSNVLGWIGGYLTPPTGTVTFIVGDQVIGTSELDPLGRASIAVDSLELGNHQVIAIYGGSATHAGSASLPLQQMVSVASTINPSAIVLTSSRSHGSMLQAVTFTAQVTPNQATGTVAFMRGGRTIGRAEIVSGQASITTRFLLPGTYRITAVYEGDHSHSGSLSSELLYTVTWR